MKINETNKALFLDRDGTLVHALPKSKYKIRPPYIKSELKFYNDIKFLKKFNKEYLFIIVTNQPDIKRGLLKKKFNDYINCKLKNFFFIKAIYTCFDKNSKCYKPKTFMVREAIKKYKINKKKSYVIGDTWRDIELGNRCRIKTILVDRNHVPQLTKIEKTKPKYIIKNFKTLSNIIKFEK